MVLEATQPVLDQHVAKRIVHTLGSGIPPEYGFQFFSVGLEDHKSVINDEYLSTWIKDGGSAFKLVVGAYGGGKTHFLYSIRDLAWHNNYVVAYVKLSPEQSPFHKLEAVYSAVVKNITRPLSPEELLSGYETGIVAFLKAQFMKAQEILSTDAGATLDGLIGEQVEGLQSISFGNAIKAGQRALARGKEDEYLIACQWLSGEGFYPAIHRKLGIMQKIDKSTAFSMLRTLAQWTRRLGYNGLVILFDEAEQVASLGTKQKDLLLSNLRELIDDCGSTSFQGVLVFYAVPDESFLEGRTQIYEALRQRVTTIFDVPNPTGVKIDLEKTIPEPLPFLRAVGMKLTNVFEKAYECALDDTAVKTTVERVADWAYERRRLDIGYKRLFVQTLLRNLHAVQKTGKAPTTGELEATQM